MRWMTLTLNICAALGDGNGLHPLQLKIAMRAAQLLRIGGRLVYSTCSLNPIEDEAVVAAMLKQADGGLQLMDMSGQLPNLRRVPGVKTWEAGAYTPSLLSST